uniref:Uncharacterized protein n=1 Tax=Anguilla anguilla TaxID=7936 RepID=A0A0E9U760_ANGAN
MDRTQHLMPDSYYGHPIPSTLCFLKELI